LYNYSNNNFGSDVLGYDEVFLDWVTNEYGDIVMVHNFENKAEMVKKAKEHYYSLFSYKRHVKIFKNAKKNIITGLFVTGLDNLNGFDNIGALSALTHLSLNNNNLNDLPGSMGQLSNLTHLNISSNKLNKLPASIGKLSKLAHLNMSSNSLNELPEFIGGLSNLILLDANFNQLKELPDSIGKLSKLSSVRVSGNRLEEVPEFIGNLSKLTLLAISGNHLNKLPDFIGRLSNLLSIGISNNNLKELPEFIGGLSGLTNIDASFNKLSELPWFIGQLSNLTFLGCSNNNIKKLSNFMGGLSKLIFLDLSYNDLSELPDFISTLPNLTHLALNNNNLTELPRSIGSLSSLTFLATSNNKIEALPDSIGTLPNLNFLDIGSNKLKELPDSMRNLSKLTFLDLSNLKLSIIPKAIATLGLPFIFTNKAPNKGGVWLYNTKLLNMDINLFEQPQTIIKDFYDNITEINECKLIFLGDGEVGKTSIIERMVHPEYETIKERTQTDGIRIENYTRAISEKKIKLRIWDFGGQEIMHTMHKCFMTSRSIYIVVLDARQNQFLTKYALYWLDTIETFAPDSPVVIVINKIDLDEDAALNEAALKEKYPNLKLPIIRTSYFENIGFDDLREIINDTILNSSGYKYYFNKKWLPVKEKLENMGLPYIKKSVLFKENQIGGRKIQESLLKYFKDIGISYYYRGENISFSSENIAVLNPEWLTGGIYRLITNAPRNNSLIPRKTIDKILSKINPNDVNKTYTYEKEEEVDFVLDVMRQFEISHKYKDFEFIPLKLPKTRPEKAAEFNKESALHISWKAEYLPFNAIHRLIVKFFDDIDFECIWIYGGLFKNNISNKSALIYMDINEQQIDAFVNAEDHSGQKEYLSVIRKKLHKILWQLNITRYEENIHYTVDGKSGKINYLDVLKQFYNRPNYEIFLRETEQYILPGKLLHNIYTEKDVKDELTIQFGNKSGIENSILTLTNINNGKTNIGQPSKTNESKLWVSRLLAEETITETQISDFLFLIGDFLDSKYADDVNFKDITPLQGILSKAELEAADKNDIWAEVKTYFAEKVTKKPQVISSFASFIENSPTVIGWVKKLFENTV
jgi:small GTP-binding protein